MGKVVVAGGSGFIGAALVEVLQGSGHETVVLSRSGKGPRGSRAVVWDGKSVGPWAAELEGAMGVVNLAGHPVMDRWTPAVMEKIRSSRVETTRAIGEAIASCQTPPTAWVNASAVGYYGDTGAAEVSEASPAAMGFLGDVCRQWEAAVDSAVAPNTRKVKVRIGFVLGRGGGALPLLSTVTKAFLGGPLGSGRQYVPWIHVKDLARIIVWALTEDVHGAINGTAPRPVTNADLMAGLRAAFGRPPVPAAPEPLVRLMLQAQGLPADVVLGGTRAVPAIPLGLGFQFEFETLAQALADLIDDAPRAWSESVPDQWVTESR